MISASTLAQLSDNFVYSSIAVYVLAMLLYAAVSARRSAISPVEANAGERNAVAMAAAPSAGPRALPDEGAQAVGSVVREPQVYSSEEAREGGDRLAAVACALTVVGFGLHVSAIVVRGLAAQRAPWGNMYEFALVATLAAVGAFLVWLRGRPTVRALGVWLLALVVLTLGLAVTVLYTPAGALVPVLNTYWLVIHVAAAMIAGGVFTVSFVATVLYRVALRGERRRTGGRGSRLPTPEALHKVVHSTVLFAFPVWTFAVIAGAIWAENSWGRYWGWDPKETWAFITWVLYAAFLHAEATAGWRGRKASWFSVLGYAAFIFNFVGVNIWIPGLHSYAGL
jgi:cytochrome c-type biogenesis protein CcsB